MRRILPSNVPETAIFSMSATVQVPNTESPFCVSSSVAGRRSLTTNESPRPEISESNIADHFPATPCAPADVVNANSAATTSFLIGTETPHGIGPAGVDRGRERRQSGGECKYGYGCNEHERIER